jgi:nucleotide-binding universal stress UspA family protein
MTTSLRPKTILFATDFLESSRLALDFAVAFAHHYQAKLLMVHVFHMPQAAAEVEVLHDGPSISRRSRETRLEAFAAGVRRAGVDVEWRLVEGWMPEALLRKAQEIEPDLLVLGTHGVYRGLGHMLIGSNAEEVLLSAPCPTLTAGRHVSAGIGPDASFEHVLYITDFTPESAAAAPYAVSLSQEFDARLYVCHLLPDHGDRNGEVQSRIAQHYCEAVSRTLPNGEASWCSPGAQLEHGVKAAEILQRARGDTAGLIVLGVKSESQFARHLHTSLAFQLVATAACPVFAVCG